MHSLSHCINLLLQKFVTPTWINVIGNQTQCWRKQFFSNLQRSQKSHNFWVEFFSHWGCKIFSTCKALRWSSKWYVANTCKRSCCKEWADRTTWSFILWQIWLGLTFSMVSITYLFWQLRQCRSYQRINTTRWTYERTFQTSDANILNERNFIQAWR